MPSTPSTSDGFTLNTGNSKYERPIFRIYPNPVLEDFTIVIPDGDNNETAIKIFNVYGETVLQEILTGYGTKGFSLKNQAPGIYLIRIIQGARLETHRIIKQ